MTRQQILDSVSKSKFLSYVVHPDYLTVDICWNWIGGVTKNGYGAMQVKYYGKYSTISAHKIAWSFYRSSETEGLVIRHSCDNRVCVNPNHLVLGSYVDNARDTVNRKRIKRGISHYTNNLTEDQIKEILLLKGKHTQSVIAQMYGVSQTLVWMIHTNKHWSQRPNIQH